jgi:hypothetical protein
VRGRKRKSGSTSVVHRQARQNVAINKSPAACESAEPQTENCERTCHSIITTCEKALSLKLSNIDNLLYQGETVEGTADMLQQVERLDGSPNGAESGLWESKRLARVCC